MKLESLVSSLVFVGMSAVSPFVVKAYPLVPWPPYSSIPSFVILKNFIDEFLFQQYIPLGLILV
nr:MAG TPA: gas vesicle protein [Caudoviricetes sp.]